MLHDYVAHLSDAMFGAQLFLWDPELTACI
jgi:hypothetical protein